jgi:hypothetical protein
MTEGIGGTAVSQGYEMLAAKLAKNQQKQEGQMMMQLLQSASTAAPTQQSSSYGNLGQNINIQV